MLPKKLLSYLYPIKIKELNSKRSGSLEITMVNGKLVMDAKNVNYSYGSLQKALKKGLLEIGITKLKKLESILVLGVAGGSVIQTLRNDLNIANPITGVEIDADTITLANEYFKLNEITNLDLQIADAFEFIKTSSQTFDLIIIDIFNDNEMPAELFQKPFWINTLNSLNKNGLCLFNSTITSAKEKQRNKRLQEDITPIFKKIKRIKTQKINELFILEKS